MIFVTIGTQEPFDRLVMAMDQLAEKIDEEIIIQTPQTCYKVQNIEVCEFLSPTEYDKIINEARLIISHAGMGTILSALMIDKPILIMPRIASLGEHRNEHQLATAHKMLELEYTYVAKDVLELEDILLNLLKEEIIVPSHTKIEKYASKSLLMSLSNYINTI